MSSKNSFEPVTETGWKMGLRTLFKKELKTWFGTNAWWQQAGLWSLILVLFGSVGIGDPEAGVFIFYMMAMIFPGIAIIIISQERILEEKRSGSAAWVLSKPVSRTAFILSKFIPSALGFCISMMLIPGILFYVVAVYLGATLQFGSFLISLIPLMLWQLFLSWLTMCLATFFEKEGPVMAVPFPFLFIGPSLAQHPIYGPIGPWGLLMNSISITTSGNYPVYPIIITVVILVLFLVLAIVRFQKHEF
ncbi:MAG: ABC transporter permease [Candidatus Thorarchaeota archaeon]